VNEPNDASTSFRFTTAGDQLSRIFFRAGRNEVIVRGAKD
jgi:hypothetical protein